MREKMKLQKARLNSIEDHASKESDNEYNDVRIARSNHLTPTYLRKYIAPSSRQPEKRYNTSM